MGSVGALSRVFTATVFVLAVSAQSSSQPNIVFVLADDLGFNDVGYHNPQMRTPNLDRLAREGVRLESYYVQPMCTPTRVQLMTGRYQAVGMPLNMPTLADKLREAGYATHMVGKWHLGFFKKEYLPNNRGFDTFYGFLGGSEMHYEHRECVWEPYGCGHDLYDNFTPDFSKNGIYSTHLFTQKAIDVIKSHDKKKPLFLYLPYQAVHSPLEVPKEYKKEYDFKDGNRLNVAGMATCMDEGIGNVAAALQETGIWNNTIFIFSTDNGGELWQGGSNLPLRGSKGSYFEGGIRAVGFVTSPLLKNKAYTNNKLIHVSDWFPTLVKLARGSLNGTLPLDGFNQWETISENSPSPRTEMLINIDPLMVFRGPPLYTEVFDTRMRAAIRVGDYKLITGDGDTPIPFSKTDDGSRQKNIWLYNIKEDPTERSDVSDSHPDLVKRMATCMDEGIGNVAAALQETGLWNNTIFIFSTDNGGELWQGGSNLPRRGSKGSYFEGGIRAVGFVTSPLLKNKAYTNNKLIHVSDWFPTLVKLARGSLNGTLPLDGFNQWETISENSPSPRTEMLINIDPLTVFRGPPLHTEVFDTRMRAAIRVGDYKLITGDGDTGIPVSKTDDGSRQKNIWLYNIKEDPTERSDVSDSHPDLVKRMLERLAYHYSTSTPAFWPPFNVSSSPRFHNGLWGPWQ